MTSYSTYFRDDTNTLSVTLDAEAHEIEVIREVNRNNIKCFIHDIPELDGYELNLKYRDGSDELYGIGTVWWDENFMHNGIDASLFLVILYSSEDSDKEQLHSRLGKEFTAEETAEFTARKEATELEKDTGRILLTLAGDDKRAQHKLRDFRDYKVVRDDAAAFEDLAENLTEVAQNMLELFEFPTNFAQRIGPKLAIKKQQADTVVVPLTGKNIEIAKSLIPPYVTHFLYEPFNKDRYCLVFGFRHIHRQAFDSERVLTTLVLLESTRADQQSVVHYAVKELGKSNEALTYAADSLAKIGKYKAHMLLAGKSQARIRTNSITLSHVQMSYPVITGKTVWVVEGQNDALALYGMLEDRGLKAKPDFVLALGTANVRSVFNRTDLPLLDPRSTKIILFLDNKELNSAAERVLKGEFKFLHVRGAEEFFATVEDAPPFDRDYEVTVQYSNAIAWLQQFGYHHDITTYLNEELENEGFSRSSVGLFPGIKLNDVPALAKKPKPKETDADDFVESVYAL